LDDKVLEKIDDGAVLQIAEFAGVEERPAVVHAQLARAWVETPLSAATNRQAC
jgi:hypothetical protein